MNISRKVVLILVASLVTVFFLIAGCGGTGGGAPTPVEYGPEIPIAQRMAFLDAVQAQTSGLTYENFADQSGALVQFLVAQPEVLSAEVLPDQLNTILVVFTDGRLLFIDRTREPSPQPAQQLITRAPGYALPGAIKAASFWCFDDPQTFGNSATRITDSLRAKGYDSTAVPTQHATVQDIKNLGDSGVILIESHGNVVFRDDMNLVVIDTREVVAPASEALYKSDLDDRSLVYASSGSGSVYRFSQKFVTKHLNFDNSIIFMNACSSMTRDILADAFLSKGAGAYFGWSRSVEDKDAVESAYYLFDLLLGQNTLLPDPDPNFKPQPPMNWQEAFDKMAVTQRRTKSTMMSASQIQQGNPADPSNLSFLKVKGRDQVTGTILPAIKSVTDNPTQGLFVLTGSFGFTPGTVVGNPGAGDIPLTVQNWGAAGVTVSRNAAVTSVQVSVGPRKSNVFKLGGTYRVSGPSNGPFESKEQVRFWVGDQLVYTGTGTGQAPFTFSGNPGQRLRFEVKSNQNFGGPGHFHIQTPSGTQYKFVNKAFDYFPNPTTRICFEGEIILQP